VQLDGDGFPRQRETIRKYTAEHGMRIVQFFEEKAVPGKTEWEQRPAWLAMLQKITDNGVRIILIEKLDRLARDLMVQEHIIADLRRRGITLISALEPDLCVDDPTRKLLRQIMGAIAEYDRAMIVLKMRAARDRKRAATGRCEAASLTAFVRENRRRGIASVPCARTGLRSSQSATR
jgi:DNA invertase Pin-like site-specific DNA recombinase